MNKQSPIPCPNCQSDNENIAITTNNTCPVCGRLLTDIDFEKEFDDGWEENVGWGESSAYKEAKKYCFDFIVKYLLKKE